RHARFQHRPTARPPNGGALLPFDPENPPVEEAPQGERLPQPSIADITALATSGAVKGPGIVPEVLPTDGSPGRERTEWLQTNLRPQKQGEYCEVIVSLVLGDITAGQMRALALLSSAYSDGMGRVTVDQIVWLGG